jgi:hypothetical protein
LRYIDAVNQSAFVIALRDFDLDFQWRDSEIVSDPWWKRDGSRRGWAEEQLINDLGALRRLRNEGRRQFHAPVPG